jgi:hypothetical protein
MNKPAHKQTYAQALRTVGKSDYYKPPYVAFDDANVAIDNFIDNFVVQEESGEKKRIGYVINERLERLSDDDVARYSHYLEEIKKDAIFPLVFSDLRSGLAANNIQSFLGILGLLNESLMLSDPLPKRFDGLEKGILDAAKTAFDKVVAVDRAKQRGGLAG